MCAVFSTLNYVCSLNDRLVLLVAVLVLAQICAILEYRSPKAVIDKPSWSGHTSQLRALDGMLDKVSGVEDECFACHRRACSLSSPSIQVSVPFFEARICLGGAIS